MTPEMACFHDSEEQARSRDFSALVLLGALAGGFVILCALVAMWCCR